MEVLSLTSAEPQFVYGHDPKPFEVGGKASMDLDMLDQTLY